MRWLSHILGLDNASGAFYLFHSGAGANLGEYAMFGILWRRFNCHEPRCWRICVHHDSTGHATCHRHKPPVPSRSE